MVLGIAQHWGCSPLGILGVGDGSAVSDARCWGWLGGWGCLALGMLSSWGCSVVGDARRWGCSAVRDARRWGCSALGMLMGRSGSRGLLDGKWPRFPRGASASYLQAAAAAPAFAQLSTKQRSGVGADSHPRQQMGVRRISGLGWWDRRLQGVVDIPAAFVLGSRGNLGAELEGWRRESQEVEQKVGNTSFFPRFKCRGSCKEPGSRDRPCSCPRE